MAFIKQFYFGLFIPIGFWLINLIYFFIKGPKGAEELIIFGLAVAVINGALFFYLFKKNPILGYFLQGIALLNQILILIFLCLG